MPIRRLSIAISPVLRFVDWIFDGEASGFDVLFMLGAAWWLFVMLVRPENFDTPPLVGMDWAPDAFWIVFVTSVAILHGLALWRPRMYRLRMGTALVSAWYWLTVSWSLGRLGISTGTGWYALVGAFALMLAVYLSGRDQHRV